MLYRDLLPGRAGGRVIASHIRIPDGGPVADYVHHHAVDFQIIYCLHGRVSVVYEDQGPPFDLTPGDCVLQPPHIRHRVLDCSPGLEVVEVSAPAEHRTFVDHELALPTVTLAPGRDFGGQRFVRSRAKRAVWDTSVGDGFSRRETGIGEASAGAGQLRVLRADVPGVLLEAPGTEALEFFFVIRGRATAKMRHKLAPGDAATAAPFREFAIEVDEAPCEVLQVTVR